jgi:hypothetical protein
MRKIILLSFLTLLSCPQSNAQVRMGSVGPGVPSGGGFAAPNAYGYAGSYTGGSGYARNFGYNTMQPGNMPYVPGYGNNYYGNANASPFGVPQPYGVGGGFYNINYGGRSVRYWQSPSGYYYPWLTGNAPIAYAPNAGQAAQATAPPISTICSDLITYLEQQKDKGNISQEAFEHLKRRAVDIRSKERDLRTASGGAVDSQDEASMRRDLDGLGNEVAKSVNP